MNEVPRDSDQHYSDLGRVGRVIWDILALSNHLHDIRQAWAKHAGVTAPQWMILFALSTLDEGEGVPVDLEARAQRGAKGGGVHSLRRRGRHRRRDSRGAARRRGIRAARPGRRG